MPFHRRARSLLSLVACCALATSGCGGKDAEPDAAQPGLSPSAASSTTTGPTPTTSSTTSPPTDATPADPIPKTLADRLLATADVPGLNKEWRWQDGETAPASEDPFGLCAKVDLASIGATEVVERSYFPPVDTDDSAAEQIAEFPDSTTANRAAAVLKSWHQKCRAQVPGSDQRVGAITSVSVEEGVGSWYLVSYGDGVDEVRFHAFGTVVSGTRIAVLSIDNGGQDYNYARGKEPMVGMVRAAATRLG